MRMSKIISGTLFLFTIALIGLTFSSYWENLLAGREIPKAIDYLVDVGFISAFTLWLWMMSDFFKAGPKKGRIAIGFAMLFFNLLAAPIYWLTYYSRQTNT